MAGPVQNANTIVSFLASAGTIYIAIRNINQDPFLDTFSVKGVTYRNMTVHTGDNAKNTRKINHSGGWVNIDSVAPGYEGAMISLAGHRFSLGYELQNMNITEVKLGPQSKNRTEQGHLCDLLGALVKFSDNDNKDGFLNTISIDSMFSATKRMLHANQFEISNTGKLKNMNLMFALSSIVDAPMFDTSSVTSSRSVFLTCPDLQTHPVWDLSNTKDMYGFYSGCKKLTNPPLMDLSKCENFSLMYGYCESIINIPHYDFLSATNLSSMFRSCLKLESVGDIVSPNATTVEYMFYKCNSLNSVPSMHLKNVTTLKEMFRDCRLLEKAPIFDTPRASSFEAIFAGCLKLKCVAGLDTRSINMAQSTYPFYDCHVLCRPNAAEQAKLFKPGGANWKIASGMPAGQDCCTWFPAPSIKWYVGANEVDAIYLGSNQADICFIGTNETN